MDQSAHTTGESRRRVVPAVPVILVVVVALVLGGVLLALFLSRGDEPGRDAGRTSIAEIVDNPSGYLGHSVLTSGIVKSILSDESFVLKTDDTLVLVPGQQAVSEQFVASEPVYIQAEVITFDLDSGSQLVGRQLPADEYGQYVGQVALVASGVSPTLTPSELD